MKHLFILCLLSTSAFSMTACKEQASAEPAKPAIIHSELGEAGKSLYISNGCIGCHGAGGQSRNPGKFPALAGKSADYITQQLQDFKSYKRRNPMMSSVAWASICCCDGYSHYCTLTVFPNVPADLIVFTFRIIRKIKNQKFIRKIKDYDGVWL